MICALCLREEKLCDSHIIPEFLYTTLYDDKHRFHSISLSPEKRNRLLQKGIRERLLCLSCEQALSEAESYVSKLLYGGIETQVHREGNWLHLSGLTYKHLKLFQLSVLWRAGVSKLPVFSQVKLGPHEEVIRKMLHAQDPGAAGKYGCLMSLITFNSKPLTDLVVEPTWARLEGHHAYRFVFGGLLFIYVVTRDLASKVVRPFFAQENGDAWLKFQPVTELPFLTDAFTQIHSLGKLDDAA